MQTRELLAIAKDKLTGADKRCWDRDRDGRMADFAVDEDQQITTVPYEPGDD
ncbi:hypothetical protein [Aeromicrobium phragmitis]|uniref:hypothetical protein n=1 Tax=Aeromicrobium phragmitis TaxID=2478914 RepID=UPI0014097452|nr:hypothetical protein [Aeromicrobium phragmitis]